VGDAVLAAEEHRLEVHVLDPLPGLQAGVEHGHVVGRGDPGVVEQHVDPAEVLGRAPVQAGHLALVGDVGMQVQPPDLGRHLLPGLVDEVDHAHPRPLGREPPRAGPPDPAGRPGDDGHLPLQPTDTDRPPSHPATTAQYVAVAAPLPATARGRLVPPNRGTCRRARLGAPFGVPVLVVGGLRRRRAMAQNGPSPSLAREAIGLREVLFQSITHMAPAAAVAFSIIVGANFAAGALPLSVIFALVGCLLVAVSIGQLARRLPSAGGFTTYAARGLHPAVGFLVGWGYAFVEPLVAPLLFLIFGNVVASTLNQEFGWSYDTWWVVSAVFAAVVVFVLGWFGVRLSTGAGMLRGCSRSSCSRPWLSP
jgi:hypothetical protein